MMRSPVTGRKGLPRRFWVVGVVAFVLNIVEGSSLNSVLSVFIKPMTDEFGWSRGTISGVATVGAFVSGLLGLAIGPLMDRRGVRVLTLFGVLVLGGSLLGMGFVGDVWSFYAVNGLARISSLAILSMAITVVLSNWFVRLRGRAMGLTYFASKMGGSLMPLLALYLVTVQGWRGAWTTLGLLTLTLAVPVYLYFHHRPEDVGLLPDGAQTPDEAADPGRVSEASLSEPAWTVGEAARTPALWLLSAVSAQAFLAMGALNMHQVPYMIDAGIPQAQAVSALTVNALAAGVGGFLFGMIAERVHVRYALAAASALGACGIVFLVSVNSLATAYSYAIVGGTALGGTVSLTRMVWAEYYGRRSVGGIQGLVMPIQSSFNALGPLLAGWAFDVSGSYIEVFSLLGGGYALAAICALLARPARKT